MNAVLRSCRHYVFMIYSLACAYWYFNRPSCTDRDLCIRIFDVADDLIIKATEVHSVHHFAESGRPRLSSRSSTSKKVGILRFAHKHERRMTKEQREAFWDRAKSLFSVVPGGALSGGKEHRKTAMKKIEYPISARKDRRSLLWNEDVTCLLFGVISNKPHAVTRLIEDIAQAHNITSRVLLLANGCTPCVFEALLKQWKVPGVVIPSGHRMEIADARTMLQMHCGTLWMKMTSIDAVVILDDDKRLSQDWFFNLRLLLRTQPKPSGGFIGPDIDAPPLPAAFTARTSLIDLFYAKLGKSTWSSDLTGEDLFYDLSERNTHHLEYPADYAGVTAPEHTADLILKGIPLSRKATPAQEPTPSTLRGGCCVVLYPELLTKFPNPTVRVGGVVTRRSDMLWVQSTQRTFIQHPGLAVHHSRTDDCIPDAGSFMMTARKDLLGSAIYRPAATRKSFLTSRLKQLSANLIRIQGLEMALNIAPQLHFCYQTWVTEAISSVNASLDLLVTVPLHALQQPPCNVNVPQDFVQRFRTVTAEQLLLRERQHIRAVEILGMGSEGITFRPSGDETCPRKLKVMDCYRPNDMTFSGEIAHHSRDPYSTIIDAPLVEGKTYSGGHGPAVVNLLRKIQDQKRICFRNWKPSNLIVNKDGMHFIDIGRDVVTYSNKEFDSMVRRAYLVWRFPNHGNELKRYCNMALKKDIPQLGMVDYLFDAVNERAPDNDLYAFVERKVRELLPGRILDFGSGRAKFMRHTGIRNITNYDPEIHDNPEVYDDIEKISGKFDIILCVRVLCVLSDEALRKVLQQIRSLAERHTGRLILTVCDPRGIVNSNPEECCTYEKTVSTGRKRPEFYRPLRVIKMQLIRAGFEVLEEFTFWRIDYERFEKYPNQWCCVAKVAPPPRHTILIKTCLMEHATISQRVQHLVETLPCGIQTILVLDGRSERFQREYAESNRADFYRNAEKLRREWWIDVLLEPPNRQQISTLHLYWFGFQPDFSHGEWTHDHSGAQYASTFYGFSNCKTDLVLQVDSDLMVYPGNEFPTLPYALFDENQMVLTWSLPIASHTVKPFTDGHRFEVRGCLVSISRLRQLLQLSQKRVAESIGRDKHWYRIVDEIIGEYKSVRGGQRTPFFVHPQNDIKKDNNQYLLAIDAVQSGRLHPEQYENVDWVGWPQGRSEPFVILTCGRNVASGRMLRCIRTIANNVAQAEDVGVIVIDDSSSRQTAEFLRVLLRGMLPPQRTTFVSRRKRVGLQANLVLGCRNICANHRSVICTVDLDDALLGTPISMIRELYNNEPDLEAASGGCVHVHKPVRYIIDDSRPVPPREARGQAYWTHLRTFRKALFDRVLLKDLYVNCTPDNPNELASDWAYSIPIWEQARKVKALHGDLYLYEPGTSRDRQVLERQISRVMSLPPYARRRYCVAVIGDSNVGRAEAYEVGYHLAKAGYIVMTGGLDGVMMGACRGAKQAQKDHHRAGAVIPTIGILPGTDPDAANPFVDVPIPTGMGQIRNGIVAYAHAVVVVGGRAGTHSEVAMAWSARRLVVSMRRVPGCSMKIADQPFDTRRRYKHIPEDRVYGAETADDVVTILSKWLPHYVKLQSRL